MQENAKNMYYIIIINTFHFKWHFSDGHYVSALRYARWFRIYRIGQK